MHSLNLRQLQKFAQKERVKRPAVRCRSLTESYRNCLFAVTPLKVVKQSFRLRVPSILSRPLSFIVLLKLMKHFAESKKQKQSQFSSYIAAN